MLWLRGHQVSNPAVNTWNACSMPAPTLTLLRTGGFAVSTTLVIAHILLGQGRLRLDCLFERGECVVPELLEVRAQRIDPGRVDGVEPPGADRLSDDEVGAFENPQVLRDGRPADWKVPRELADRHRAPQQPLDNGASRGVAERVHLRMWVSSH